LPEQPALLDLGQTLPEAPPRSLHGRPAL